ncbi:hypothetical protein ABU614_21105 [Lysobacter firmicutimachus]|uniref:PH domain-containing protein n=1 Tax=Lysobacter firmicutimachus TaxID=1792846 RepID=A0AAU8MS21_9GAMM
MPLFAAVLTIAALSDWFQAVPPQIRVLFLGVCIVAAALTFVGTWNAADEVIDAGDRLRLRRRGTEATVPLADIEKISIRSWSNPSRIELRLRKSGGLGDRVMFIPRGNLFGRLVGNRVYLDLCERVERTRRGGAA